MIIAGKYKNRLITRCCLAGKYHFNKQIGMHLGDHCYHTGYSCHSNGCDMSTIKEITDDSIINEATEQERLIEEESKGSFQRLKNFSKEDYKIYFKEQDQKRQKKTKQEIDAYLKKCENDKF